MFFKTADEFKQEHFNELVNLFAEFDNNCRAAFKKRELKIIDCILNKNYNKLFRIVKLKDTIRKIIRIRWNSREKYIKLFGRKIQISNAEIFNKGDVINAK